MRNTIIDNLRGLSMLGVLSIHVISATIDSINSFTLFFVFDLLTRYSIPTFFFISGYGLFCHSQTGSYLYFLRQRLRSVGIPYLFWSFFYLLYRYAILPPGSISWLPKDILITLLLGVACYHLYFVVILMWFYTLNPLWCKLVNIINRNLVLGLGILFIFQIALYYYPLYYEFDYQYPLFNKFDIESWSKLAQLFYCYRESFFPLYYIFFFILGTITAQHWQIFITNLRKHAIAVLLAYASISVYFLNCVWLAYKVENFTLLELCYTFHQLSYQGFPHTVTTLLVLCLGLHYLEQQAVISKPSDIILKIISMFSTHSALIYFLHPLVIYFLTEPFYGHNFIFNTTPKIILLYFITLGISLLMSILLTKLFQKNKLLRLFLTGK